MRSLELKTLQIKDDLPLYVTLYSKAPWGVNENGDIKRYKLVTRHANCFAYAPVYNLKLYPSSNKEKIDELLQYFFKVCDVGASPHLFSRQMIVTTLAYFWNIRDMIRLNLILYAIKY